MTDDKRYFSAIDPVTGEALLPQYRCATPEDVARAAQNAEAVFYEYSRTSYGKRAQLLKRIADEIESLGDELLQTCHRETALPLARLLGERARTTSQLHMFADLLKTPDFSSAIIDRGNPQRSPLPKPDCRQMRMPIGPVAVFGASNFPLAFSTAGGDTASALAAGCPVVLKGHPAHPGTCSLTSKAISNALKAEGLPAEVFQCLQGWSPELSDTLVRDPHIAAVGFTGSLAVGRKLFDLAQSRDTPIPFYGEMGSVNPIFFFSENLAKNTEALAQGYINSLTLGVGQFCTNPGIAIGEQGDAWDTFKRLVSEGIEKLAPGKMLRPAMAETYRERTESLYKDAPLDLLCKAVSEDGNPISVYPQVWELNAEKINDFPHWQEETFGPSGVLINCKSQNDFLTLAKQLDGQLTAAVFADEAELQSQETLLFWLARKSGRVIFNGFPTGVEVCHAMQHGGPYPASTDSRSTSVGSQAIFRFLRPVCFQDAPQTLLPDPLKDSNPLGLEQKIYQ